MLDKSKINSNPLTKKHKPLKPFIAVTASALVSVGGYQLVDTFFVQDSPASAGQDYFDKDTILDTGDNEINKDEDGNIIVNPPLTDEEKKQYLDMLNSEIIDASNKRGVEISSVDKLISINSFPYDDNYDKISLLFLSDEKIYNLNYIHEKNDTFQYKDEKDLMANFAIYLQNSFIQNVELQENLTGKFDNLIENLYFMGEDYYGYQKNVNEPNLEYEFIYIPFFTKENDTITAKYYWALSDRVYDDSMTILQEQLKGAIPTPIFTLVELKNQKSFDEVVDWYNNNSNFQTESNSIEQQ